jgi:histidine triad (HIT) family protein
MASIFSKIISGEIPCNKIHEDDLFIAFLDIMPVTKGHVLVVPKKEVDNIFDNDDATLSAMLPFAKKVSKAIEKSFDCNRVGISVIGLEVPHTHMHLMPISNLSDMDFTKGKLKLEPSEMTEIAEKIKANLSI